MDRLDFYRSLATESDQRILFFVIDGLGGLPHPETGLTELEAAATPTLDALAAAGESGLATPVLAGVTPGSGPAHISLFGYDPLVWQVGRGVLAALGVEFDLRAGDVAARINFCSLDPEGRITDRRAGRIGDQIGAPLAERLDGISLGDSVQCSVRHVKQYRACVVFRGAGLDGRIADTDPQATGVPPLQPVALDPAATHTAALATEFIGRARELLSAEPAANGVTLRGFDSYHPFPSLSELYGLDPGAVASYPMYQGVARLAGMTIYPSKDEPDALAARVSEASRHDFVFLHYKGTDSRGEDGDYDAKVAEIESADSLLARVRDAFDVVMVTGDHSTPWSMRSHSWHPVPVLIASRHCRPNVGDGRFGESACVQGSLGHILSMDIMPLVLAHAGKLKKFGA